MDNVHGIDKQQCNVTTPHGGHIWPIGAEHVHECYGVTVMLLDEENTDDPVNHPKHYTSHPSGVECIEVTRHMSFNLGNVVKYIWRSGIKGEDTSLEDLKKAAWYLNDEIEQREKEEHG